MDNYELRSLCIENNWFTCGSNDQYSKLFQMNRDGNHSIREIALIIWLCSDDVEITDIEIKLYNAGLRKRGSNMTQQEATRILVTYIGQYAIGHSKAKLDGDNLHIWVYGDYRGYYNTKTGKWIEDK